MTQIDCRNDKKGFVLVILAGLLIVMGIFMLKSFPVEVDILAKKVNKNDKKLTEVKRALLLYYEINGKLPCPSDPNIEMSDENFGSSSGLEADCTDKVASPTLAVITNGSVNQGGVPIKDVGLPLSHAFDEWGNRLTYVMDSSYTDFEEGGDNILVLDSAGVAVTGVNGGEIPVFMGLVISHGKDGVGAFNRGDSVPAVRARACVANTNTQGENCDDDVNFMSDKWNATNDDLIEYLTPCPAAVNGCALWLDGRNINGLGNTGLSNGDALATWVDKSGSGNTATSSGARRPGFADNAMNGIDTVNFGPSNHDMDVPALEKYASLIAVFNRDDAAQFLGQIGSGTNYLLDVSGYDKFRLEGGAESLANLTTEDRDMMVYAESPDSTVSGSQVFSIGKSSTNLKGGIAEFVVYPTALNESLRTRVQCHMARKWATFPKNGLQLWLDATDTNGDGSPTTGEPSDNTAYSAWWQDKTANNFDAKSRNDPELATDTSDPVYRSSRINGKPALVFGGAGTDVMTGAKNDLIRTATNQFTLITVARGSNRLISYAGSSPGAWDFAADGYGVSNGVGWVGGVPAGNNSVDPFIRILSYNGSNLYFYLNTALAASAAPGYGSLGNGADARLRIARTGDGSSTFFNGDLGEILIYNRILTDEERLVTQCYLSEKWGVGINYP